MPKEMKSAAQSRWVERTPHRLWLLDRADALFSFFEAGCRNPLGGYFELDEAGKPMAPGADGGLPPSRNLHITTRLVHAFSAPFHYLFRPYIVYRSRDVSARLSATKGRGWDPVGTRDNQKVRK